MKRIFINLSDLKWIKQKVWDSLLYRHIDHHYSEVILSVLLVNASPSPFPLTTCTTGIGTRPPLPDRKSLL